jgi:hypothetical protein
MDMKLETRRTSPYRDIFVSGIKLHYEVGFRTRTSAATKTQSEISNYLQHLKADLARELEMGEEVIIEVSYITEGVFAKIQVNDLSLKFIRTSLSNIEVWGDYMVMRDDYNVLSRKLETLKGNVENIEQIMDDYLEKTFSNHLLLDGEITRY